MSKIPFYIPIPVFLMRIILAPLLLYRRRRYNRAFMRIRLAQSKYAVVDFDDFCSLISFRWHLLRAGRNCYAERPEYIDGALHRISMHRVIMNAPKGVIIDHINRNSLDNRKSNLRIVTRQQNNWNSRRGFNSATSKYKGVFFDKKRAKFRAVISVDGKKKHLGHFDNEQDAARAYDKAAILYRGQFAALNFPNPS